ncbi:hypothetical protein PLICRDRAFT_177505 [Plicaturopsis crispa FD-325 SS-3]|nr:hypothetical protein PLICRDRAFT_177505 [Plicaturopsis crispa FD-325 SS-3]
MAACPARSNVSLLGKSLVGQMTDNRDTKPFITRRISVLKNTPAMRNVVVLIVVLAVMQGSATIAYAIQIVIKTNFRMNQLLEAPTIWLVGSFLCDVLIAGSLLRLLKESLSRTAFKSTETILTRLIVLTVQTGFITAIAAGLQLIAYLVNFVEITQCSQLFSLMISKLYSNVLLATLNARASSMTRDDLETGAMSMKSGEGIHFRSEVSEFACATRTGSGGHVASDVISISPPKENLNGSPYV